MTRADVERKFRGNVGSRWPRERTDAILQTLWALDKTKDLSELIASFQFGPR
jgi:2-methylcitrate dehydratase